MSQNQVMAAHKHHFWTAEEEKALRDGVAKHGVGKWMKILNDQEFASSLINRSNVDLKDKWRNLTASASGSVGPAKGTSLWYHEKIFEELSSEDNVDGLDLNAIQSYIQERGGDEAPKHPKRYLRRKLCKFVQQGKLEKNDNLYRIKHSEPGNHNPNDVGNSEQQTEEAPSSLEEAAAYAAYMVAIAENKEKDSIEQVKKAERLDQGLEEATAMLALAEEIFKRCERGEIVHVPPRN